MSFRILSQMERTRREKEESLRNTGFNVSLILAGAFTILGSFLFLAFVGLAAAGEGQPTTSSTGDYNFVPVCASMTAIFGLLGIIFIFASILRRRKINRDLEAAENEYQLLHSQVMDMVERS